MLILIIVLVFIYVYLDLDMNIEIGSWFDLLKAPIDKHVNVVLRMTIIG